MLSLTFLTTFEISSIAYSIKGIDIIISIDYNIRDIDISTA